MGSSESPPRINLTQLFTQTCCAFRSRDAGALAVTAITMQHLENNIASNRKGIALTFVVLVVVAIAKKKF